MSRTTRYKALYFGMVLGGTTFFIWATIRFHLGIAGIFLLAMFLLIPGRVLGFYWRDLLQGLRLLKEAKYEESKRHSEIFLVTIRLRPWLKKLIWLGSGSYSRDPEALALNNLGAAEVMLGEHDGARMHLQESIAADKLNPLPYFNMGALLTSMGESDEASSWFARAVELGYSRNSVDKIIQAAQSRFARTDGHGSS